MVMSFSIHVSDAVYGRPAEGMVFRLYSMPNDTWEELKRGRTDGDGRVSEPLGPDSAWTLIMLEFDLDAYFSTLGIKSFYPVVTITFRIPDRSARQQLSLLVTPWAYVTSWER
jgi:5-hydroxyisourate hydrolase